MADATSMPIQSYAAPYGSALIGTFLATVYGITVLQAFLYYHKYHYDRKLWKVLVGVVMVLDTVSMALFMRAMYYYLVESWGLPEMTSVDIVSGFPAEYIVSATLTFIVQLFYINTVRALHAPAIVPLVLLALATTAFVTGLMRHPNPLQIHRDHCPRAHQPYRLQHRTALVVDLGVVAALCLQLRGRAAPGAPGARPLTLLAVFALQRGALQALVQAGEVIAYAAAPAGVLFLPFHVIVGRVYCTSLLVTLTTREFVLGAGPATATATAGAFTSVLDPPQLFSADTDGTVGLAISLQDMGSTVGKASRGTADSA